MSTHCNRYPGCGCPEEIGTKCHLHICSIISKLPLKKVEGDCCDVISAASEIEILFKQPVPAMEDGCVEIKEGCEMPNDNEDCLVWTELATKWQASTFNNKRFYRYSNAVESDRMALYYFPDVVKWMPLPPPPSK